MSEMDWNGFADHTGLQKVFDPAARKIVYDELPTLSIKRTYRKDVYATGGLTTQQLDGTKVSQTIGSGSAVRITAINIFSALSTRFTLKDQTGTFLTIRLEGTNNTYRQYGNYKEPLHVARGGFRIGHQGTATVGEMYITVEGYEQPAQVGFGHRGSR